MSGTLVHLSSFKNLGYCLVLGIEYFFKLGTDVLFEVEYCWVPGSEEIATIGYKRVTGGPWVYLIIRARTGGKWSKSTYATDWLKVWNFELKSSYTICNLTFSSGNGRLEPKLNIRVDFRLVRVKIRYSVNRWVPLPAR